MKFVLLGASGLLGRHLHKELAGSAHSVVPLSHAELDICHYSRCAEILEQYRPDVVINAAAFCSFDGCERSPDLSEQVNLHAPCWWSKACAERGIRLVLFSSDYIFDGSKGRPYEESDPPSPLNIYGEHKAELERRLMDVPTNLVFRPAWIFGAGGKTFMSIMPDLFLERRQLEVASGKKGSCLHAGDAARKIVQMAADGRTGLWNLVHPGATSWEEFAAECLKEMVRRGYPLACESIIPRPFENLASGSGKRPPYSVLDTAKLDALPEFSLPPWQEGLRRFLDSWAGQKSL